MYMGERVCEPCVHDASVPSLSECSNSSSGNDEPRHWCNYFYARRCPFSAKSEDANGAYEPCKFIHWDVLAKNSAGRVDEVWRHSVPNLMRKHMRALVKGMKKIIDSKANADVQASVVNHAWGSSPDGAPATPSDPYEVHVRKLRELGWVIPGDANTRKQRKGCAKPEGLKGSNYRRHLCVIFSLIASAMHFDLKGSPAVIFETLAYVFSMKVDTLQRVGGALKNWDDAESLDGFDVAALLSDDDDDDDGEAALVGQHSPVSSSQRSDGEAAGGVGAAFLQQLSQGAVVVKERTVSQKRQAKSKGYFEAQRERRAAKLEKQRAKQHAEKPPPTTADDNVSVASSLSLYSMKAASSQESLSQQDPQAAWAHRLPLPKPHAPKQQRGKRGRGGAGPQPPPAPPAPVVGKVIGAALPAAGVPHPQPAFPMGYFPGALMRPGLQPYTAQPLYHMP